MKMLFLIAVDFFRPSRQKQELKERVTIDIYADSFYKTETVKKHIKDLRVEESLHFSPTVMSKLTDRQVS